MRRRLLGDFAFRFVGGIFDFGAEAFEGGPWHTTFPTLGRDLDRRQTEDNSGMASIAQLNVPEGLPASIHVEVAVLGAMLLDGVAISDATAKLKAEDFSLDSHQRIYRAMVEMMAKGHGIDSVTVGEELARRRELDAIGGPAYLAYLTEGIPRNFNIESYVRIVKDKSLLRQLMGIFHDGQVRASD